MSEAAIHDAVVERLKGHGELVSLLANGADSVLDHVPQAAQSESNAPFPFVTFGDDDHDDWGTDDTDGYESALQVHVWSRHRGRGEVKDIQAQVYAALHHHELLVAGVPAVLMHFVSSSTALDPDGRTYHGVQSFRLLSERSAA